MINGISGLAQGVGHGELLADAGCGRVLDFAMTRNRARPLGTWVVIDGVLGTFAQEETTVSFQVSEQIRSERFNVTPRKL